MEASLTTERPVQSAVKAEKPLKRLPSLDGLRAICIVFVLLGHLNGTHGFRSIDLGFGDYAHLGVVVFFVISGFLITSLLMAEHEKRGRVSLAYFYVRRTLRIFPALYVYLAVIFALSFAGAVHLTKADAVHALTYTVNFEPLHSWQVGHLWSLSVEEQFYLLWPAAFIFFGIRKANWTAAFMLLLGIFARVFNRLFLVGTEFHDAQMFPMVADSLAAGCLLALLRCWLEEQCWYMRLFRPSWSFAVLLTVLLLNRYQDYTLVSTFGTSLINICLAFLIHRSVHCYTDLAGRVLNWKPLAFVGTLSYSIYLWQQLFLNRNGGSWVNWFPQNIVLAIAAGLLSYFAVEQPLLSLRHHFRSQSTS